MTRALSIKSEADPAAGNRTTFGYDASDGRRTSVTDALGKKQYFDYDLRGNTVKTWGDTTYPVSNGYDDFGVMTNMTTYRGGSGWTGATWPATTGDGDETTWTYDEATGLLTAKTYDDGDGPTYTYTAEGDLATRTWERQSAGTNLVTTYTYTNTGEMVSIDYSDGTPDVSFTLDRLGRQVAVTDAVGTRDFVYGADLQLASEDVDGEYDYVVTRSYETNGVVGRSAGFEVRKTLGGSAGYQSGYGYDGSGRLNSLTARPETSIVQIATYFYLSGSDLLAATWSSSSFTPSPAPPLYIQARAYESNRDLITQVKSFRALPVPFGPTYSQYDYTNDVVGRRGWVKNSGTAFEDAGDAFEIYGYNDRGEVTSADRYFGTDETDLSSPMGGRSSDYDYDNIGNRNDETRSEGEFSYTANALNQYVQRTVPSKIQLAGTAHTNATVTVMNQAVTRQGAYYHHLLTVANSPTQQYHEVAVTGVRKNAGTNNTDFVVVETGRVFVADSPESFTYDDDGNMLTDDRWSYTWNGENRLSEMETKASAVTAGVPREKLVFVYDYMGRRARKTVYGSYSGGAYGATNITDFVYDGWNMVQERKTVDGTIAGTNSYVWGLDLSGSLQGAGGIGGLLFGVLGPATNSTTVRYFTDANGNVGQVVDVSTGELVAEYEYDAFGRVVRSSGDLSEENPYKFSTKYEDETELLYYGYRYYMPEIGRWPSRDPINERGGLGLYRFVLNNPIDFADSMGLYSFKFKYKEQHGGGGSIEGYDENNAVILTWLGNVKNYAGTKYGGVTKDPKDKIDAVHDGGTISLAFTMWSKGKSFRTKQGGGKANLQPSGESYWEIWVIPEADDPVGEAFHVTGEFSGSSVFTGTDVPHRKGSGGLARLSLPGLDGLKDAQGRLVDHNVLEIPVLNSPQLLSSKTITIGEADRANGIKIGYIEAAIQYEDGGTSGGNTKAILDVTAGVTLEAHCGAGTAFTADKSPPEGGDDDSGDGD